MAFWSGKKFLRVAALTVGAAALAVILFFGLRASLFPRPYRETAGDDPLVYAVMKAESGFSESAKSSAGAVGLMQLLPSTAEFICRRNGLKFEPDRLTEGEYNVRLGRLYLAYLSDRFGETETALAAYNAGEGVVSKWLKDAAISPDGKKLAAIPYPETADFVKKVIKFRNFYKFLYH